MHPVVVPVRFEERYWYPDDGGIVWVAGFHVVDPADGRFLGRDAPELVERGLVVAHVAGAVHHDAGLQSEAAAPGAALALRRDAGNVHDANAIAVDTATGEQVGWVPREVAARLAPELDRGRPWAALVLRERRDSPRDPRTGLTMVLAPAAEVTLQRI